MLQILVFIGDGHGGVLVESLEGECGKGFRMRLRGLALNISSQPPLVATNLVALDPADAGMLAGMRSRLDIEIELRVHAE